MKIRTYIFLLLAGLFFACNNSSWSYRNADKWPGKFKDCAAKYQSPINIDTSLAKPDSNLAPLFVDYLPADTFAIARQNNRLIITGPTGSVTVPDTAFWGHIFYLVKLIIHSPSETAVNGKYFPAELQFIHRDTAGNYMVLSVLVDTGGVENKAMELIVDNYKRSGAVVPEKLDLTLLMPYDVHYWHFTGSLSYPPCTPAQWYVMQKPLKVSPSVLEKLQKLVSRPNTRAIKPLNGRRITEF